MRGHQRRPTVLAPAFWGDSDAGGEPVAGIRPTSEPDAVIRSLGQAPLAHNEYDTRRHFRAVCEEAVRAATALAAANGLLVDD